MDLAAIDLNLLVPLKALLEEVSVSRAARRVGLSQPAMSHALSRLRTLLDDPLLVRTGTQMQLTVRGEGLRDGVKDALARVRDLLMSETFDPIRSIRTFRIFVADNAGGLILPALLQRLQDEAPGVSIRLQEATHSVFDPFELSGKVDAAIACVPERFTCFYQQRLFTDRDACAVRNRHPLGKRLARPEVFFSARHVAVVGREFQEDPVDTWLRGLGRERRIALTAPHYLQALHVVAQTDLLAIVPERLIRACAPALDLQLLQVPLDVGTFDEYLLHPLSKHTDPGCIWLRKTLQEIAKSLGPLRALRAARRANYRGRERVA